MSDPISIQVREVTVRYNNGNVALQNASFNLSAGVICALVGVNGSGKSTLFKSIMGFVTPNQGEVRLAGMSVQMALRNHLVAYVPQSEEVDWNFPVSVHDVALMGRYGAMNALRIPKAEDLKIVEESLTRVGMLEFKNRQIGELSGGQKKRAFLARALAQQGRIMLLDEPFTGVDVKTETAIISLLRDLKEMGHIILVSTHNLGSVPEFCDQVVLINRTVLAAGPTEEVFTQDNLSKAFGGVLREIKFDRRANASTSDQSVLVVGDDERPLVMEHGRHIRDHGTESTPPLSDKK